MSDSANITPTQLRHPLQEVAHNYIVSIKNIGQTVEIVMPHLSKWLTDEIKKCNDKLKHYLPETDDKSKALDAIKLTLESARDYADLTSTARRMEELATNRALPVLARSLFVQMFCEFDAFMGLLLKNIYIKNKELLKGISREISLTELLDYEDLEGVKRAMLDKEVETFRRDSYVEQFNTLERKFNITLKKFNEWGDFVELSQRRNIFTHNDGMVSDQYITVCEKEGFKFKNKPKIGEQLVVDYEYFEHALDVMSKVGYMLCHTLWSKVFPKENVNLHESLNNLLYDCLQDKRWKTATELGEFALSEPMRKSASEIQFRIRLINVAIALKFSQREDAANKLLNSLDWSASYRDFKLAIHVLKDEFDDAIKIMKSIGKSGEVIQQHSYHTWPLFHKFRERPEFYSVYEEIYGEPYYTNISSKNLPKNVTISSGESTTHNSITETKPKIRKMAPRKKPKHDDKSSLETTSPEEQNKIELNISLAPAKPS